jgi:hypothetical protein
MPRPEAILPWTILLRITRPSWTAPTGVWIELWSMRTEGVTGHNEFDANGDVANKPMAIFVVRNGDFQYLGASR